MTRVAYNGGIRLQMTGGIDLSVSGTVTALLVHAGTTIVDDNPPFAPRGFQTTFKNFGTLDEVATSSGYSRQLLAGQAVVPTVVPAVEVQAKSNPIDFGAIASGTPAVVGILFFKDGATDLQRTPIVAYVGSPHFPPTNPDGTAFRVQNTGTGWLVERTEP